MDAEPTMRLYLCLRRIPAWIHAFRVKQNQSQVIRRAAQVCLQQHWLTMASSRGNAARNRNAFLVLRPTDSSTWWSLLMM